MKFIILFFVIFLSASCSNFKNDSNAKDLDPKKGDSLDVLKTIKENYKESLKSCFDLETFSEDYDVVLIIKIQNKGKVSSINLKDKKSFKMTKNLRKCIHKSRKSIKLSSSTKRQTLELEISDK